MTKFRTLATGVALAMSANAMAQNSGPAATPTGQGATPGAQAPSPDRAFRAIDTDHDGKITVAEWKAAGRSDRGLTFMDADKNGTLDLAELTSGLQRVRQMRSAGGQQ